MGTQKRTILAVIIAVVAFFGPPGAGHHLDLFEDMRFERGFLLSYPDVVHGRSVERVLDFGKAGARPVWRLCQWGTRYSLADAECVHDNDEHIYANRAKRVLIGGPASPNRDLILEVHGSAEYGDSVRRRGRSWPHLLVEQDATELYRLDECRRVELSISCRLLYCRNRMGDADYNPSLHAAQFQLFLIVRNINREDEEYGEYYWFGVPLFDSRHAIPPAYMAKDAGKSDATGKFIYTVDGRSLGIGSLADGTWLTLHVDLLPFVKCGLGEAVSRGYVASDTPRDYAIANMNMGWEIPGTFDAAFQVRDLRISAVLDNRQ